MNFVLNFPFFSILFTMAAGIICSVLKGKHAYYFNVVISLIVTTMSFILLMYMVDTPETVTYLMGHFSAPWGNEIKFGPLESLMAFIFSLSMLLIIISQKRRFDTNIKQTKVGLFYVMLNLMMSSLFALIYTNDLFTAYVFIEINTLCACGIMLVMDNPKSIAATIKYLLMSLLGSGLFLVSIILLYDLTGHLLMPNVQEAVLTLVATGEYRLPLTIIIGLLAVGMGIKSALFPFHTWVGHAYNHSMNFSNAISSGMVMKGYAILLIKFFYVVFDLSIIEDFAVGNVLIIFGIIAIVVGSYDALKENNIKRMLGFSSVGQMGYIFVGIGLATNDSMLAACFVIISHCLCKAMLFLANEGLMLASNSSKNIMDLKGAGYRNVIPGIAFVVGAISLIGIPLFPGFVAKYLLSVAAISNGVYMLPILIAIGISTVLNAIYLSRFIILIYTVNEDHQTKFKNIKSYNIVLFIYIALNILLGIYYQPILDIISKGLELL